LFQHQIGNNEKARSVVSMSAVNTYTGNAKSACTETNWSSGSQ